MLKECLSAFIFIFIYIYYIFIYVHFIQEGRAITKSSVALTNISRNIYLLHLRGSVNK